MDTKTNETPQVLVYLKEKWKTLEDFATKACDGLSPLDIIILSVFYSILIFIVLRYIFTYLQEGNIKRDFWFWVRRLPFINGAVQKKLKETSDEIEHQLQEGMEDINYRQSLPKHSTKPEVVLRELERLSSYERFAYKEGYVSGAVYSGNDEELKNLVSSVYNLTAYSNPLHPDVFPGIRVMEAEIVKMISSLYKAPESIGTVTSGGTESIFLVCKAYRDYARFYKRIRNPNMVIPITAHAAFDKAAQLLNIRVKHVKFQPETTKVDINAMGNTIDENTIMIVGSAPAFPHGSIDPIEAIAKIGHKYKIPVHVDACLGGFLLPFMERAGFKIPAFDFSVPGVTSISCDTHKYAYAPKGTSVILYSDKKYRHHQFSVQPDWPGGIYATPNLSGSRSGGVIATCWAALLYHGEDTYIECTKKIITTAKYIEDGLQTIEGIHIVGKPEVSVIAIGSKRFDIYRLSSALTEKGWNLNVLQFPSAFHICLTLQHTYKGVADRFLTDVEECTKEILKNPGVPTSGAAAIYGMAQQIPDRSLVSELTWVYLDALYSTKSAKKKESEQNGGVSH